MCIINWGHDVALKVDPLREGWQLYHLHYHKVWEPQPPGTLCPVIGLSTDCFTSTIIGYKLRGSASFLGLWVRVPPWAWMSVSWEYCVFSVRSLCDVLITRPEDYYRMWCAWVWSWSFDNEEALAQYGLCHHVINYTCTGTIGVKT